MRTGIVLYVATAVAVAVLAASQVDTSSDNGWGAGIAWHSSLEEARAASEASGKPQMVIIHKSWCGACKSLRPKFAGSAEIAELSRDFEMFNALDDEEPKGSSWAPDGGYIPRILFAQPGAAEPDAKLWNPTKSSSDKYLYFYPVEDQIVQAMKLAVKEHKRASEGSNEEL